MSTSSLANQPMESTSTQITDVERLQTFASVEELIPLRKGSSSSHKVFRAILLAAVGGSATWYGTWRLAAFLLHWR
ncbi:MAG TPA: hypothetical protein VM554_03425 [Acidisarcina sp.]|nr:hypothetical protein [Acidisarcina sp.]